MGKREPINGPWVSDDDSSELAEVIRHIATLGNRGSAVEIRFPMRDAANPERILFWCTVTVEVGR